MKKLSLFLSLLFLSASVSAQLKIPKERWTQLYKEGNYRAVNQEALAFRKKEYGKSATVDFFIAKSLCASGKEKASIEWFDYILKNYKIADESKDKIRDNRASCSNPEPTSSTQNNFDINILQALASMETPQSSTRGKGGAIYFDCEQTPETVEIEYEISEAEFQSRLFELDQSEAAISTFESILGPDYQYKQAGRFIIITKGITNVNNQEAQEISKSLENAFNFYINFFGLRPPDKLLTVCLLPNKETLQETALKLHGIRIPSSNWGYSHISDLSLLGWATKDHLGTLLHELFHLMIGTDIGDAPPWLDEGIASLYESSIWKSSSLMEGTSSNWRTEVMRKAFDNEELTVLIPKLEDFLKKSWEEFDGSKAKDICTVSIHYAYGRNFIVYVQKMGKLQILFEKMKNRTIIDEEDFRLETQSSVEVIESVFELPIAEVEKKFLDWLDEIVYEIGGSKN